MEYHVVIAKKFRYIRAYNVIKSVRGEANVLSRFFQAFTERYLLKNKKE